MDFHLFLMYMKAISSAYIWSYDDIIFRSEGLSAWSEKKIFISARETQMDVSGNTCSTGIYRYWGGYVERNFNISVKTKARTHQAHHKSVSTHTSSALSVYFSSIWMLWNSVIASSLCASLSCAKICSIKLCTRFVSFICNVIWVFHQSQILELRNGNIIK